MKCQGKNAQAAEELKSFANANGLQIAVVEMNVVSDTDPMIVVKTFEQLINTPGGSRLLRTIAGLDFGFQTLNDPTEPIRKAGLESMGIADWDGPHA